MKIWILGLVTAFSLTGCCSFCEKHCDQCKQPPQPPPGYVPAGAAYYPGYIPAAAANPCAPVARSAPLNCTCQ